MPGGSTVRALGPVKTACIGPVTAEELGKYGLLCDILPESYRAESVVEAFAPLDMIGKRVLLPRAAEARVILPEKLREMGASVDEVVAYETVSVESEKAKLLSVLEAKEADLVTFTSSSTATNFKGLLPEDRFAELVQDLEVASIGPITSETAKKHGFSIAIEAAEYTIDGLVTAIRHHVE